MSIYRNRSSLVNGVLAVAILLLSLTPYLLHPQKAEATATEAFVRFDRLATGSAISGTACLKSTLTTQGNVQIDFPSGWTISGTASNWTTSVTNLPTDPVGGGAASAWPGIGTANNVSGHIVTFPGSAFSAGTFYCFNFTGASSTIGSSGNDQIGHLKTLGGSPFTDSVDWAVSIVTNAPAGDQITVTASVSATMTFSLSGSSVALGTLSTGSTASGSGITQTVSTNARNGWVSWVKSGTNSGSNNGGLFSSTANAYIPSPGSFDGTPETLTSAGGYVLDVDSGTGSPTVNAEYNGSGANQGGHLDTIFRQTASNTVPAGSDTVILIPRARSSSTTPAASDYTDTLTISAAGSF